jgi:hypothetical protein
MSDSDDNVVVRKPRGGAGARAAPPCGILE